MKSFAPVILEEIDVVILCGGLGTRLSSVLPNRPKSLAPIGEKVFLDILIQELQSYGFQRFILCVGHLSEQIVKHFQNRNQSRFMFSIETVLLGTGGAVPFCLSIFQQRESP